MQKLLKRAATLEFELERFYRFPSTQHLSRFPFRSNLLRTFGKYRFPISRAASSGALGSGFSLRDLVTIAWLELIENRHCYIEGPSSLPQRDISRVLAVPLHLATQPIGVLVQNPVRLHRTLVPILDFPEYSAELSVD